MIEIPQPVRLTLPATSANLGSAFDAAGLAMGLKLIIEARVSAAANAPELTISATGRDAERCSRTSNNLIFETYREVLDSAGRAVLPLELRLHNEIPLGMGCGSSAAALLAGVMLASHFGRLAWNLRQCMEEACVREGHPDNVAACALGYLTVSAETEGRGVVAVTCGEGIDWKLLLALPAGSLATERARALLPPHYSRADAVHNIQRAALLTGAFANRRGDLLAIAMQDRIHQPYRSQVCPLLPPLLGLAGSDGILGVALSGAGPGVLLVASPEAQTTALQSRIRDKAGDPGLEVLETRVAAGAVQNIL